MLELSTIIFDCILPWWCILACTLLFALAAWKTYGKCHLTLKEKLLLWGLRMLALLIMIWLLCLPIYRTLNVQEEKPAVAVVVDMSASMEDNPMESDNTRGQRALAIANSKGFAKRLSKARLYRFGIGEDLVEGWNDKEFTAPRTLIADKLKKLPPRFRGDKLAAIILFSDGLDQSLETLNPEKLGAPVYVPELEEPGTPKAIKVLDFKVGALAYPKRVVVNWKATVNVSINRNTGTGEAQIPVELSKDGATLQKQTVAFKEGENVKHATFEIEPDSVGPTVYAITIFPNADGVAENNSKRLLIDVTDDNKRILYLEGTPRWEFKFLKRSLVSEKNLLLNAFIMAGNGSFINFNEAGESSELPTMTKEYLSTFKTVILGDLSADAIPEKAQKALKDFVEAGGSLLVMGGSKAYKPDGIANAKTLKSIMPATSQDGAAMREGRFSVDFTPEGRALPAFAPVAADGRFPPLISVWAPVKQSEFTSSFMATTDGTPVLVAKRCSQGRTAMLLSDSLWRWQMGGGLEQSGKGLYARFITQLLYWLSPDDKDNQSDNALQVLVADPEVDMNQKISIGAIGAGKDADAGVTCTITTPTGKLLTIPMVRSRLDAEVGVLTPREGFKCDFIPNHVGTYKIDLVNHNGTQRASSIILARYPERERTGAVINRAFLHNLAEKSGGKWVTWSSMDKLLDDLELEAVKQEVIVENSIWNHWGILAILMATYCLEWYLRRKWDLV